MCHIYNHYIVTSIKIEKLFFQNFKTIIQFSKRVAHIIDEQVKYQAIFMVKLHSDNQMLHTNFPACAVFLPWGNFHNQLLSFLEEMVYI